MTMKHLFMFAVAAAFATSAGKSFASGPGMGGGTRPSGTRSSGSYVIDRFIQPKVDEIVRLTRPQERGESKARYRARFSLGLAKAVKLGFTRLAPTVALAVAEFIVKNVPRAVYQAFIDARHRAHPQPSGDSLGSSLHGTRVPLRPAGGGLLGRWDSSHSGVGTGGGRR